MTLNDGTKEAALAAISVALILDRDRKLAKADAEEHGYPPTPARWQRKFKWGYGYARRIFEEVTGQ